MQCQLCKVRTATIHLTELKNGQRSETHLCQECAEKEGIAVKTQIPLNELLTQLLNAQDEPNQPSSIESQAVVDHPCPSCGMTLKRFSNEKLLGCEHDYEEFKEQLLPLIEKNHRNKNQHCGKVPKNSSVQDKRQVELMGLKRLLEQAVKDEDYEMAAELRDRIANLDETS